MSLLKRTKTQNTLPAPSELRRFFRNQQPRIGQQLYTEGVLQIIKCRLMLQLSNDTIFMSIDIFKNYLLKQPQLNNVQLSAVCIASVWMAAKVNQIYPPDLNQITESFDYFGKLQQIIRKQEAMIKQFDFLLPYENNMISILHQNCTGLSEQKIQFCIKILYKCIPDPFLMRVQNRKIVKSLLLIEGLGQIKQTVDKQNIAIAKIIRQKYKSSMDNKGGLELRDMNMPNFF